MAKPHEHAYHPPASESARSPESARKRGVAAGGEAARAIQATSDAWNRKIGTSALKTMDASARK